MPNIPKTTDVDRVKSIVVKFDLAVHWHSMASITNDEALEMRSKLEKKDADSDQLCDILQQLLDRVCFGLS